jgi:hypothetical protein
VRGQALSSPEADGKPRGKREQPGAKTIADPSAERFGGDFTTAIARMPHGEAALGRSALREERGHPSEE